jgi:hypothetical protein
MIPTLLLPLNICANIAWIVFIGITLTGVPLDRLAISRTEAFTLLAAYFLAFYLFADAAWVSNGNLPALRREFAGASPSQERVRGVIFWTYAALSIAALPLTGIVAHV